MCAAKAEIGVSIPSETPEGSISVSYKGLNLATTLLALKRSGQQPQQTTPLPASLIQYLPILAGMVVAAVVVRIAVGRLRRR